MALITNCTSDSPRPHPGAQIGTEKAGRTAALSARTVENRYSARSCSIKYVCTAQCQHKREPCGIRKYPGGVFSRKAVADLFGQVMNGEREDGFPKGRERALKYAAGVRARGERRYAISERTVKNIPVEYFLAMEANRRLSILWPSFSF